MARIRTVKPEFWGDEKLSPLSPLTRLTFLGLISMADDAGRMVDNAKVIDAFVFPNTNHSTKDALDELARLGRIIRGVTASGQKVVQIAKWLEHQKIEKPNLRGSLPPLLVGDESGNDRGGVGEESENHTNDQRPTTNDPLPEPEPTPDEWFDRIWSARPRRPNDSKADARKAFFASLARGADPEAMLDGITRYAEFCAKGGVSEPRFIKQTATFLGPGEWWLADYAISETVDAEIAALVAESRPEAYVNADAVRALMERAP